MARQAILSGSPFPVFLNETGTRQAITAAAVFVNETVSTNDNPPFSHRERTAALRSLKTAWQPETWPFTFTGDRQPYGSNKLNPSITAVQVDDPPFQHPGRLPTTRPVISVWQPETWPYTFTGDRQPYAPSRLNPSITAVQVDNPPFTHRERTAPTVALKTAWQPEAWPSTFAGGWQPYAPSRLNPSITAVQVDNPPFGIPNLSTLSVVYWQWQPDFWPPVFMGGWQPYASRKLSPTVTAVQVDNPPFTHRERTPYIVSLKTVWQPDSWPSVFVGGRQPYDPRKFNPALFADIVNDPPFRHPGRWAGLPTIIYTWQPPAWPFEFMGGEQPYVRGNLTPSITNVFPVSDDRVTIKNIVVRVRYVKGTLGRPLDFE